MAKPLDPDFSDEDDFDEEYFTRTYRPLSNLPTPPPSSRDSSIAQSPKSLLEDGGLLDSALLGPSIHLINLIPPSASLQPPSIPLLHSILLRADLPLETIALAVNILDSLSSKFSLTWRLLCPLSSPTTPASKRHTLSSLPKPQTPPQLHIDSVPPELIPLSALILASKFLSDRHAPTAWYRKIWGDDLWTAEQINVTERCIMEALKYRLLPLCEGGLLKDAMDDMKRAGRQAFLEPLYAVGEGEGHVLGTAHGRSVSVQLPTPVETPVTERAPLPGRGGGDRGFKSGMDRAMRDTFLPSPGLEREGLRLPQQAVSGGVKRKKGVWDDED